MDSDACTYLAATCPKAKFVCHNDWEYHHESVKALVKKVDDLHFRLHESGDVEIFREALSECTSMSTFAIKFSRERPLSLRESRLLGRWMNGLLRLEIRLPIREEFLNKIAGVTGNLEVVSLSLSKMKSASIFEDLVRKNQSLKEAEFK